VVLAVDTEAARLLPLLTGRVAAEEGQILSLETEPDVVLPSPARTCGAKGAWRQLQDGIRIVLFGPPNSGDEEALAHKLRARLPPRARTPASFDTSPDRLPRIGLLPGLPAAVAAGYCGLDCAYAFLAARWIAEAVRTGRDPTPLRFRADRAADQI
jgi:glycine/D-amino acid oxidase-like deaminating enzyme